MLSNMNIYSNWCHHFYWREWQKRILNSDVDDLQAIMGEAYDKTGKKQYKILANPKYKEFITSNIDEIRKLV